MKYRIEENLSKTIIYTFIIIMSSMIFAISYFYIQNTYDNFDEEMKTFVEEYYNEEKKALKKEINTVLDIMNYVVAKSDNNLERTKEDAIRLLNNINFETKKSNYFFAYEILNMQGGDDFALMVVNPNRPDLRGELISTNEKDFNGKKFREEFMKNIREKNESYTLYSYKKPDEKAIQNKLSYFKYYEPFNWVIALGIYTDDIEGKIAIKKLQLEEKIKKQIYQNLVLFILFLAIAIFVSIIISHKIDEILQKYEEKVKKYSKELELLNQGLEEKIRKEIEKSRENEEILIQKSKFISLGEMISNIAHQWRQPLSELSSILMFIKLKYDFNALDKDLMNKKSFEATKVIEYMSNTIDDFRNFFIPKKDKENFNLEASINSVVNILSSAFSSNHIKVDINIDNKIFLNSYLNEFQQVILNILTNAKDILVEKNIENPLIKIYSNENSEYLFLHIEDNAKGILAKPIYKIFEPYFTTKASNGTGIGLYMSKIIIEKNMKGKLKVENKNEGAIFTIALLKD